MKKFSLILILFVQIVKNNIPCNNTPFNPITNCNITCATCDGRDACKTCQSFFTLSSTSCVTPTNEHITYNQYFYTQNLRLDRNLLIFKNSTTNLSSYSVKTFCITDSYKFDMVGLFGGRDHLTFTQYYTYQISQIALNFRLFTNITSTLIKIQLNGSPAYNTTISSGFNSTFAYYTNSTILILNNNTDISSYVDKVFIPIRTGMLAVSNKMIQIKIIVQDQQLTNLSNNFQFWGINELGVSAKKCRTCVSQSLQTLTGYLGIIVGISAALVAFLVFILHIYEKIKKDRIRKMNRERYKNSI